MEGFSSVLPGQPETDKLGSSTDTKTKGGYTSTKEEIARALMKLSDADMQYVVRQMFTERPDLQIAMEKGEDLIQQDKEDMMAKLMSMPSEKEPINGLEDGFEDDFQTAANTTIVQFSSSTYYCDEDQLQVTVDVIRVGNLDHPTEVRYMTLDGTGIAGQRYEAASGKLKFEKGELIKHVQVPLIQDDLWNTTLEFKIELLQDELSGATLDPNLFQTRVHVVDTSPFPTIKYQRLLFERRVQDIPKWGLLIEYFKLNLENSAVRLGTAMTILVDQLQNVYFGSLLFIKVYLIDHVITAQSELGLIVVILVMGVPLLILHMVDYGKLSWRVADSSRSMLQKSIFRKFLTFKESSRGNLDENKLIGSMTRDAVEVVENGFMNIMTCARCIGQLTAILCFQVFAPLAFEQKHMAVAYLPLVCFPFFFLVFMTLTRSRSYHFENMQQTKKNDLAERASRTVRCYRLIAAYNQRPSFVEWYERLIEAYNTASVAESQVQVNNLYFSPWLTAAFMCIYTYLAASDMMEASDLSLGMFITNLMAVEAVGSAYGKLHETLLAMQGTSGSLQRIVTLLNLPIEEKDRAAISRRNRDAMMRLKTELQQQVRDEQEGVLVDLLPIKVENAHFVYTTVDQQSLSRKSSSTRVLELSGQIDIEQGTMVSLVGPPSGGKSVLLKIMGGAILPSAGDFFIAPHLRVIYVASEPMFSHGSLLHNLVFGLPDRDPNGNPDRVKKICRMLGLGHDVNEHIDSNDVLPWEVTLTHMQRQLVNIARALIANPEVLCLHKPTQTFNEKEAQRVTRVLESYVKGKGLVQPRDTFHLRRPRTCIITSSSHYTVTESTKTFCVSSDDGMKLIDTESVDWELLA